MSPDDMDRRLDQLDRAHGAIEERVAEVRRIVDRIEHLVRGNGVPGLVTRLDRLEQDAERGKARSKTLLGGVVTIGAGLVGLLVSKLWPS